MTARVTVIDYGIGNIFSVRRALETCGADVHVTSNVADILKAERLILPGVGAFRDGMEALQSRGLTEAIHEYIKLERPFLGICVGLQLLMDLGEEFGETAGLGLIGGRTVQIPAVTSDGQPLKRPHIGWSTLREPAEGRWAKTFLSDFNQSDLVYFVHSYHAVPLDQTHQLATVEYGGQSLTAALQKNHILGVQFHPERSGRSGLKLMERFLNL